MQKHSITISFCHLSSSGGTFPFSIDDERLGEELRWEQRLCTANFVNIGKYWPHLLHRVAHKVAFFRALVEYLLAPGKARHNTTNRYYQLINQTFLALWPSASRTYTVTPFNRSYLSPKFQSNPRTIPLTRPLFTITTHWPTESSHQHTADNTLGSTTPSK